MRNVLLQLRDGDWLNRERIVGYAWILLAVELTGLAFCIAGTHGLLVPLPRPTSTDFVSFYAAGKLAGAAAYDRLAHHLAEQAATQPGIAYNYFYYPPVFLLLCTVLARLPYLPAFLLFESISLAGCLVVARRILPNAPLLCLLAFPAVVWNAGIGQNAFMTAALFGGAILMLDRRPLLAGLLFGALCYKPHFGLLIPVALAASGRWRCFAAAAASVAGLLLASGLAFGWSAWAAFLQAMAGSQAVYATRAIDLAGLASPFGALLVLGATPRLAAAVQAMASLAMAALVWRVWRRNASPSVRAAVLLAATPVTVPVVMFYDLMLSGLALAWLVQAGRQSGFPPWQKTGLALLFVLPLLAGNLDGDSKLLIAPLVAALGVALAVRGAWWELVRAGDERWQAEGAAPTSWRFAAIGADGGQRHQEQQRQGDGAPARAIAGPAGMAAEVTTGSRS